MTAFTGNLFIPATASTTTFTLCNNAATDIIVTFTLRFKSLIEEACEWAKEKIENQHNVNLLRNGLFKNKLVNVNKRVIKNKKRNVKLFSKRNLFNKQHKV